ncbi:GCN5 family acetyltransferase [Rubrivivax sp. A210]|uniref:GNAT family N-acetyltransferase n=1 Tax=Rubrivivax sp. A210 TaxID=2772301 RepID=UPI001917AE96|nr:GNAT family N-acetyltransferase [Rubrivivax sp. A210]CAD5374311.1 GCN5 family acetyltransferase [Rubrivivax sp. A210]
MKLQQTSQAPAGVRTAPRGNWIPIRMLAPRHRERVLAHLLALADDARLLRFGHVASDEQIGQYVEQMDFGRDELYGVFDRRLRLVGMAHLAFDNDGLEVEFGVSVLPKARGKGLGTRLFEHAVMHARNRGVGLMVIYVARENVPMLNIVRNAGAEISFDGPQVVARLALPEDTLGSQIGALLDHRAAEFDYQVKLQVRRLDGLWPAWTWGSGAHGAS